MRPGDGRTGPRPAALRLPGGLYVLDNAVPELLAVARLGRDAAHGRCPPVGTVVWTTGQQRLLDALAAAATEQRLRGSRGASPQVPRPVDVAASESSNLPPGDEVLVAEAAEIMGCSRRWARVCAEWSDVIARSVVVRREGQRSARRQWLISAASATAFAARRGAVRA